MVTLTPATALTSEALDALASLHRRIADARAGFDTMVEHAEAEFRPTAERFQGLHARHAGRIAALLQENGREAEGSLMGTVNKTVVSLRAFFDRIDSDIVAEIRSGEEHVLSAFDEALSLTAGHPVTAEIEAMRSELDALVASLRLSR
jgi:hypothetical protein